MAPLDMQFSKILNDIVLLLVGGIGGIVGKRAVGRRAVCEASSGGGVAGYGATRPRGSGGVVCDNAVDVGGVAGDGERSDGRADGGADGSGRAGCHQISPLSNQ